MTAVLTNLFDGRIFCAATEKNCSRVSQLSVPKGVQTCAIYCREFFNVISMAGRMRHLRVAVSFWAVLRTLYCPVTNFRRLVLGLTHTKGTKPMANPATNPFEKSIYELEDVEYELRATLELLNTQLSLSESEGIPLDYGAVCYLHSLLWERTKKITNAFNGLHAAYCDTKDVIKSSQKTQGAANG